MAKRPSGSRVSGGARVRAQAIPFEVPWLATFDGSRMVLNDEQGYRAWLPSSFGAGERAMVIVIPLVTDQARFHANVYRYWRNVVLPLIAEEIGEANLDTAHDVVIAQLTGVTPAPRKRRGIKVQRKSTSMDAMPCAHLCDIVDRAVVWAQVDLHIAVPMSDPDWKWRKHYEELERRSAGDDTSREKGSVLVPGRARDGVSPSAAPGGG